ncbi:MAG: hypothetical protein JNL32_16920, partial [Candidatus Kapabacteria bacterium]|nr:hypothetical protein [Candidatus Kapabacteria bacterium]
MSDIKLPAGANFTADMKSYSNYYPFGMEQPARTYQSGGYRYGYNGKEKDDEVKGGGNSYDYGARIYDSRLGRWLSVDPKSRIYTGLSPYVFVANSVFLFREIDGAYFDINIPPPVFDLDRPKKNGK